MSPRLFCNVVYARLMANCARGALEPGQEEKARAALERELYAPLEGWVTAEGRLWANIAAAPDDDDE